MDVIYSGFLLLLGVFLASRLFKKRHLGSLPPGPKGLPLVGSAFDIPPTYQWLTFAEWGKKWGGIMSVKILGDTFVILNSAKYAIDILDKKSAIYSSRGRVPVAGDMIGWSEAMILQPYGRRMREIRKLFAQVMGNSKRVERFQRLVEEETQQFLVHLADRTDSLPLEIKKLAGTIIVMIAYGYKSSGDDDIIIKTVDKSMKDFGVIFAPGAFMADAFPILRHVPSWFPGAGWKTAAMKYRETFFAMAELPYKWVREQMAAGTAHPSFASALLEGNEDAEREYLIKMTAASLYAGGADTIVAAITNFFLAMTCFPDIQKKAQAEIDAVIGQDRLPSIADKDRLPYLHAIMLEILRWMPIAPLVFPHQLIEDDIHEGYFLPKGTLVLVNVWNILHDPALYPDPMKFNPERFRATPDKEAERDPRDFAFGFGRRKCPGIFFAEASIFAAIAETLAVYNISKATDANGKIIEPRIEPSGAVISHPAPFRCKITVRSKMVQALLDGIRNGEQESQKAQYPSLVAYTNLSFLLIPFVLYLLYGLSPRAMGVFVDGFRPKSFTPRYPRWMVGRPLLITSSALASLGDAMFGYSQGVIAALQVQPPFIRRFFGKDVTMEQITTGDTGVDAYVQAITVACLNITAFIAALCAAYICDVLGRRMSVRIGGLIYLVAAIIQIFSPNLASLIVGRSIQGIGVGILSMTVPILQCEIAPGHSRGLFISIEYTCLNLGYALSSWIGFGFFFTLPSEISWKGPYVIQAALAFILVLWSFVLPETPRFLIKNGFLDEGLRVLADLHANGDIDDTHVRATHAEIRAAIKLEESLGEASWRQVFMQYKRRTVVGITCQVFAQFNGINAILYFLPSNLLRAGFSIEQSLLYAAGVSLVYCAGTVPTMFGIDRLGRRPFLLVGSFTLVVALCIAGGLQYHVQSLPRGDARMPGADGIFAAVCLYLFMYGATWGPGPWLLGAEIYPMRARAKGMALSTTANWISNFILAFITPPLFASIAGGYYFLIAGFCAISGFFVYFFYPETAHKTLEELGSVFNDQAPREEVEKFPGVFLAVPGATMRDDSTSDQTLRGSISSGIVKKDSISSNPLQG